MFQPYFRLPDFLSQWPYPRQLNSHGLQVAQASTLWISSYNLLNARSQRAFDFCNPGLLASLAYPHADQTQLRVVCDALHLVLLFDDYSDVQSPPVVRQMACSIMDSLKNPYRPSCPTEAPTVFSEVTRSFWSRALETISPSCARRFVQAFDQYTQAIVQEAEDRARGFVRDTDSYLALRRETIGAKLAFALLEDGFDFPPEVHEHPVVVELTNAAIDMISLCNDAYSYNAEQSRGDDAHNMVTCLMRDKNINLDAAMLEMGTLVDDLARKFLAARNCKVPSWGDDEIDGHVAAYIDGMGNWVRANAAWSFESQRYFGPEGLQIQKHRTVALRPKRFAY